MESATGQLALQLSLPTQFSFKTFYVGENKQVVEAVYALARGVGEDLIYLWGALGCGRTHLLQAACTLATDNGRSAVYLPLAAHPDWTPEVLEGLENLSVVCLDDISACSSHAWQEALFHLYNRLRENGGNLLVAANATPQSLGLSLRDWVSRLAWGVVFHLPPLGDDDKIAALQLRAQDKGLDLSEHAGRYLLNHCPRDTTALFLFLDKLDQASLCTGRRLTVPFVKEVLGV